MGILMVVYNIVALIVILMGCESIYLKLKDWVRWERDEGKTLIDPRNAGYFDGFVIVLLIIMVYILINRVGWTAGPLLHWYNEEIPYDDRTPIDYIR